MTGRQTEHTGSVSRFTHGRSTEGVRDTHLGTNSCTPASLHAFASSNCASPLNAGPERVEIATSTPLRAATSVSGES